MNKLTTSTAAFLSILCHLNTYSTTTVFLYILVARSKFVESWRTYKTIVEMKWDFSEMFGLEKHTSKAGIF